MRVGPPHSSSEAREGPRSLDGLIPKDGREIRAFRIALDMPMGGKRATGQGSLIESVVEAVNCFYAEVVQHLSPWASRPPKMPTGANSGSS